MGFDKRGQLTIFVIIAVVVVVGIVLYFYLYMGNFSRPTYDEEVSVLRKNLINCLEDSYRTDINIIAFQGGYLDVPEPKEVVSGNWIETSTPYYYYENKVFIPEIEKIESEIKSLSTASMNLCFDFVRESDGFTKIEFNNRMINVEILDEKIIYENLFTMNVEYGNKTVIVDFSESEMNFDSNFLVIYELASFIANSLNENNEWMPYSDIIERARRNNVYVSITDSEDGYENTVEIYNLDSNQVPVTYNFKNKFSHGDLTDIYSLL